MNLDEMLNQILSNEGGYVNHPNDRGGPTNMGITLDTLSKYLGRKASIEELKTIDKRQVKEIYTRKYLVEPRIDTLPEEVVPIMFDTSILFGSKRAVMFLQKIINLAGFGPIDADGVLGPETREATFNANIEMQELLNNAIVDERILYHQIRVQDNPSQEVFLKGWINRANKYRK